MIKNLNKQKKQHQKSTSVAELTNKSWETKANAILFHLDISKRKCFGDTYFFFLPMEMRQMCKNMNQYREKSACRSIYPHERFDTLLFANAKNGAEVLNSREHKPSSCKPFSSSDTGKEGKFPSSKVTVRSGGLWALMQTNHHITGIPKYFTIILPPAGISKYMPLETLKKKNNQRSLAIWCNKAIPDWYVKDKNSISQNGKRSSVCQELNALHQASDYNNLWSVKQTIISLVIL